MKLRDLADALGATAPTGATADLEVDAVTHQADWAGPRTAFVAIRGAKVDGHDFAGDALARGAVVVIGQGAPEGYRHGDVPYLQVTDARIALAEAAAALADHPTRALHVIGVTGTDGKTTTSWLARFVLRHAGRATGLLSTVGYERPDGVLRQPPTHFTTPEAPQVQRILRELVDDAATHAVVEASSHALALHRVHGVGFDTAVWTNLTGEHLDFHGSMEGYFADKATLVQRAAFAVLNADDPWTPRLVPMATEYRTYSAEGADADWRALDVREDADALRFVIEGPAGRVDAVLPMIGRFNVANALAAVVAVHRAGLGLEEIVAGLAAFPGVPGRMEMIERADGEPRVIVDFAHTADSLEKALATVRVTTQGRLWVVVGSAGGPRDPGKRAPMGATATALADEVVFTEEDHRYTPLQEILAEMERGAREAGRSNYRSIGDRTEAIRYAVDHAAPQDTIVLAGKGPEETMERDTETVPWDEPQEARTALRLRSGRAG